MSKTRAWALGRLLLRLAVGAVFLVAGALKVTDLAGSVRAVNAYQLMPYEAAQVIGAALPFVEITVGVSLLAGLATRVAAATSALLLLAFTVGIASAWARGLNIDCGCFGDGGALAAGQTPQYGVEILRDVALLAAAAVLVAWPATAASLDRRLIGDVEPASRRR